jgi:hypothetical protein
MMVEYLRAAESMGDDESSSRCEHAVEVSEGFDLIVNVWEYAKADDGVKRYWWKRERFDVLEIDDDVA